MSDTGNDAPRQAGVEYRLMRYVYRHDGGPPAGRRRA